MTTFFKPARIPLIAMTLALGIAAAVAPLRSAPAHAQSPEDSAVEMLQDAYDALSESEYELARRILQQLISTYPGTLESMRAQHEIAVLNSHQDYGAGSASTALFGQRSLEPQLRRQFAVDVGDRVFFATNSAAIGGRARAMIDNQARWLKDHPGLKVTVIGRADDSLSADESTNISSARADAVRSRLIAAGVDAGRISVEARGLSDPIATCRSTMCQAQNRQAETRIGSLRDVGSLSRPTAEAGRDVEDDK